MSMFDAAEALLALITVFGYINHRFIKLPDTLSITAVGLIAFMCLSLLGLSSPDLETKIAG